MRLRALVELGRVEVPALHLANRTMQNYGLTQSLPAVPLWTNG
jgi:hypothetical protein